MKKNSLLSSMLNKIQHVSIAMALLDAAIIAVPDRLQGERSYAFVVLTDGARLDATVLRDYLRKRGVADYKIPDYFEFAESFPTTGVGKTNRRELRRIVQEYVSAKTQQQEESTN